MRAFISGVLILIFATCSRAAPEKDGLDAFLDGFVARFSKAEVDIFYVSKTKKDDAQEYVHVYWMTGNAILVVNLPTKRLDDYTWFETKARVELSYEVVATKEELMGSTYLVDAKWAEDRLKECLSSGRKIVKRNPAAEPAP